MKFDVRLLPISLLIITLVLASGQAGCKKEELSFNTTALTMTFVTDAPPAELVTGLKYPFYVDVENVGGYDIPEGAAHFYLVGVGDNLKNVVTRVQNSNFLAKKTLIQHGGKERVRFATEAEPWKSLPAPFDMGIKVNSCYDYATVTQTSVCIGKGGVCSIEGEKIKTGSNSNAPIQITSLTESIQGNKLYVTFRIENKGTGEVYLPSTDCNKLEENDLNEKLKRDQIELIVRADEGFTCRIGNIDALQGTTAIGLVTCTRILPAETYLSPFQIIVSYKYKESISKSIRILPA
ncbi:MAG: hypothetical protein K6T16_00175 [Candidatus Pacearchaeota archaeon]|nr:hypothetical protein [Candidatus Pacearchaeota archaeon]